MDALRKALTPAWESKMKSLGSVGAVRRAAYALEGLELVNNK